jgi:hypothetical protein
LDIAPLIFFLFFVGRYAVNNAPPRVGKSLCGLGLLDGVGAIWAAKRPGGGALFGGEAKSGLEIVVSRRLSVVGNLGAHREREPQHGGACD